MRETLPIASRSGTLRAAAPRRPRPLLTRGLVTLIAAAVALAVTAQVAWAFKWRVCPALPLPIYPSALGGTTSPFIHPAHALMILLNQAEVQATGGFSTVADGNSVTVTFAALFGAPVTLATFQATATSPSVLSFPFPDTLTQIGRLLTGPVSVQVTTAGQLVANIRAADLVAVPPATDVTATLLGQDPGQVVSIALGANGDLWVPASFHGEPMSMPTCPGNFIIPATVQIAGANVVGGLSSESNPLAHITGVVGYLGDVIVNGTDFYGMLYPQRINLVHVADTLGVSICRLNDAMDLVLRIHGNQAWATSPQSPFASVAADAAAIPIQLFAARPVPGEDDSEDSEASPAQPDGSSTSRDSFGNQCSRADD